MTVDDTARFTQPSTIGGCTLQLHEILTSVEDCGPNTQHEYVPLEVNPLHGVHDMMMLEFTTDDEEENTDYDNDAYFDDDDNDVYLMMMMMRQLMFIMTKLMMWSLASNPNPHREQLTHEIISMTLPSMMR